MSRPFDRDDDDDDGDVDNVNDDDEDNDDVNRNEVNHEVNNDDGNIFEEEESNDNSENEEHEEEDYATVGWSPRPAQRRRRQQAHQESNNTNNAIATTTAAGAPPDMYKYWAQRYRLFLRFDDGIQLDGDGWFSVTPERIAAHIAERFVQSGHFMHVLDLFSGFGGNAIQFALAGSTVTGVEQDASRIAMARHNSTVYGVSEYIDYIRDDVYGLSTANLQKWTTNEDSSSNKKRKREEESDDGKKKKVDAVFLSPPWGGPSYLQGDDDDGYYDLSRFLPALQIARRFSPNIAILVPRNVNRSIIGHVLGQCELELNHLGGKLKTCTIYFGGLMIHPEHEQVRRIRHFPLASLSLTDDRGYGHPPPAEDVDDDGQPEKHTVAH